MGDGWQLWAACKGLDPELFHPERGVRPVIAPIDSPSDPPLPVEEAVCWRCPVRFSCLDQSMTEADGIWGGWRAEIRATIRRVVHPCPWCLASVEAHEASLFCSARCAEAANSASGADLDELADFLERMAAAASLRIRLRKLGGRNGPNLEVRDRREALSA